MFTFVCLSFFFQAQAQTGPGGVGNSTGSNGQPINRTWFRADLAFTITKTNNTNKVTAWTDRSGGAYVAAQADSALSPIYVTGVLNNKAVVRFNGVPDARLAGVFGTSYSAAPITVFAVSKDVATSSAIAGVHTFNGFQGLYYENNLGIGKYVVDANGVNSTTSASSTSSTTSGFRIVSAVYSLPSSRNSAIFMDGKREGYYTGSAISTSAYSEFEIGGRTWGSTRRPNRIFSGDIAEVISYASMLDSAKRIIVENYLSAKYNLPITNSKYAYWNTSYRNDLAGIGRANDGSSHLEASSTILTMKTPQTLANNRYMLCAHNNGAITLGTAETPNNDVAFTRRVVREWRFDKFGGNLGTITMQIDWASLDASVPAGFVRGIMIDQDGDFRTGASFIDLTQVGASSIWQVANLNIPDDFYVTIACVKRTVSFTSSSTSGFENQVRYPVIQARLNYPYDVASPNFVAFSFTVSPTGANPATGPGVNDDINDYNSTRIDAFIPAGQSSIDLNASATVGDATIEVHNDGNSESNSESIKVTLTSATNAALGTTTVFTYFINDDDFFRKISIFNTGYITSWNELNSGAYLDTAVVVQLTVGQTGGPTTVKLVVTGGAIAGQDYRFLDAPNTTDSIFLVNIDEFSNMARVRIRLLGDNQDEDNETLLFSLQDARSGTLSQIDPISHSITIVDNDNPPTVMFTTITATGGEAVAQVQVAVRLSNRSGKAIDVQVLPNLASTALGPENDYELTTPSPITFAPGDSIFMLAVTVVDDDVEEEDESIIVDLLSATNATLASPSQFTYWIVDNDIYGASGPGGVDKSDGNGFLAVWLRADKNVTLTSGRISQWGDASGNGFHANQATASKRPTLLTNELNGQPAVRFLLANRTNLTGTILPTERTFPLQFMMVAKDRGTTSTVGGVFNTNRWAGFYSNAGQQYVVDAFDLNTTANALPANSANTAVNTAQMQNWNIVTSQYLTNTTSQTSIWMNGALSEYYTGPGVTIQNHSSYVIGSRNIPEPSAGVFNYFNGDVAEALFFTADLNEARRIIIENYLSAKYNLTITNDRYTGNDPTYVLDVAGIGTADGVNKHRVASSAGMFVRQANNTLNALSEFIMFGHASAGNNIQMITVGSRPMEVWTRSWYVQKTGSIDANIAFDYSDAGLSHGAIPVNEYDLLYRATPAGAWTIVTTTTGKTLLGDKISFNLANGNLPNGYYTLGRTDPGYLPVVFGTFDVRPIGSHARVLWTTVTEAGASHFDVERSSNQKAWEKVGSVQAAGNSQNLLNYTFTDTKPLAGISYYRLRQVDLDGYFMYSPVRQVNFNKVSTGGFSKLTIYPNPIQGTATITVGGSGATMADVRITDAMGRTVHFSRYHFDSGVAQVDLSALPQGVFTVRVALENGEVHIKNVIKN